MSIAFHGKEKFLLPKISDCSIFEKKDETSKLEIQIDDFFYSLESFIAILEPNIIFAINGKGKEPDLLFTFNMMPEFPGKLNKNILKIDVYLDKDHNTRETTYIKREEDYKLYFLKEIKEVSHGDLYKSSFSLVTRIKSMNNPF
jgi:hypothetical protein